MNLVRTVDATTEPVTLTEVKSFSRIDISDDDTLLTALISAARKSAENFCRRAFIEQTWRYSIDYANIPQGANYDSVLDEVLFNKAERFIELPRPNLMAVTSVVSYSKSNVAATFSTANYQVDVNNTPGRIYLNDGAVWPTSLRDYDSLVITYTAGFGASAASVPEEIKTAIKLIIGVMYENRESILSDGNFSGDMPWGAREILTSYRIVYM